MNMANVGVITTPNSKGQVVIPKKIRDELDISEKTPLNIVVSDGEIHISPVGRIVKTAEASKDFLRILNMTKGAWAGDNWPETERKQRKIEIAATERAKKKW